MAADSLAVVSVTPQPDAAGEPARSAPLRRRSRTGRVLGLALLMLAPLLLFGLLGPWLAPQDPNAITPSRALMPPVGFGGSFEHLLGTDHMGRDVLSRLIDGARASLIVAFFGVALAGAIGIAVGLIAGAARGWIDEALMRIVDMQLTIPPILLAVLLAGVIGGGLATVVATLSVTFWPTYARVVRAETLVQMQRDHVALARIAGASGFRILRCHVLPHVLSSVVVLGTLQLGAAVGLEAALTFLGLGVQPPASAWGLMISEGKLYMTRAWWLPTVPGIAIVLTVLGANLLGDWLRDRLDPRLRQL
jgi:peptide/nickel transport system permease protein